MDGQISEIFNCYLENGWTPKDAPDKLLYKRFRDVRGEGDIEVFINGNRDSRHVKSEIPDGMDIELSCFNSAVFFNGTIVGLIDPYGGALIGGPDTEARLIDSIKAAREVAS